MNKKLALLALGFLSLSGAAQAALIDRGGGLIYDDVLDITWLQDANYAQTSGYILDDNEGAMNWTDATTWSANLTYYDSVRNVTYSDWRLPTATDTGPTGCDLSFSGTDCGFNVDPATSEMAYFWYVELSNIAAYTISGEERSGLGGADYGLLNKGPFINLLSVSYWSDTEDLPNASVWSFDMGSGLQRTYSKPVLMYAWAVRDGDVAAIPEPEAYAMMLAGLSLVGFAARRRRQNKPFAR